MVNMINKKEFDKVTSATPDSHWSSLSFCCCYFANEQKKERKKRKETITKLLKQDRQDIEYQNAVLLFVVFLCFVIVSFRFFL